ncbi:MAG TPA: DNA polymerase III subunit delta [Acidimicrobiaceae bacterium]|nr:DNA polymerase III subunit delta [Acidimicrobiaceae bacterium]
MSRPPVILIKGADDILRSARRSAVIAEQVGDADATLVVDEPTLDEDERLRPLVDAAQTSPFFTDHRVVVGRSIERFKAKDDLAGLLDYLADPLPTTVLVLDWGGTGRVPKALSDAITGAGGETISTDPGRDVGSFVDEAVAKTGLSLARDAQRHLVDWLGDDPGKLPGVLAVLASTYGEGARLGIADVEPFLGDAGGVPPWDLTDAIDRGDIAAAITTLTRMLRSGRHPMQVMATLHTHFQRIMRLDGAGVRGEKEAATVLGMKGSTFPAKKALAQSRRLGSDGVRESIRLLARTDLELRGTIDWPVELSMEVLVARLARVAKASR